MNVIPKYRYIIFGPSSFSSLPHRGQAMAIELAAVGASVDYIEFPPSLAGDLRSLYDNILRRSAIERTTEKAAHPHQCLTLHTPPRVPTSVRNSPLPAYDKHKFRRWFHAEFASQDWSATIVWIMMPLWWHWFIDENDISPRITVYDIADDLSVFSTSTLSLRRMKKSERLLAQHVDLVTYSAGQMMGDVRDSFPGIASQYLPNAIGGQFKALAQKPLQGKMSDNAIGFVGIISDRWIDSDLLEKVARQYPGNELVIVGPMDARNAQRFSAYPNVRLTGLLRHEQIAELVPSFRVTLIPFKNNAITRVVNPLKLYEYAASGNPVVAMETEELSQFRDIVYLSATHDEFLQNIGKALLENDTATREQRKKFALQNTWFERIVALDRAMSYMLS